MMLGVRGVGLAVVHLQLRAGGARDDGVGLGLCVFGLALELRHRRDVVPGVGVRMVGMSGKDAEKEGEGEREVNVRICFELSTRDDDGNINGTFGLAMTIGESDKEIDYQPEDYDAKYGDEEGE